jgi:hypothetical protein
MNLTKSVALLCSSSHKDTKNLSLHFSEVSSIFYEFWNFEQISVNI